MGCTQGVPLLSDEEWRTKYCPVPEGVTFSEELVDGFAFAPFTKRNVYSWLPTASRPRALVLLVHGLHEHCLRYHHIACHLVLRGYAVCGMDHFGHGLSEGQPRGHCGDANLLLEGTDSLLRLLHYCTPLLCPTPLLCYHHPITTPLRLLPPLTTPSTSIRIHP